MAEETLRSRILNRTSDVVVFDHSYRSVLRADPGSGQTPGFARNTESLFHTFQVVREDPSLLRQPIDSAALQQYLRGGSFTVLEVKAVLAKTVSSKEETSVTGVLLAPPDWRPPVWQELSLWEKMEPKFRLFVGWVNALALPSRLKTLCVLLGSMWRSIILFITASFTSKGIINIANRLKSFLAIKPIRVVIRLQPQSFFSPSPFSFLTSKRLMGLAGQGMIIASIVLTLMTVGPIIRLQAGEWWNKSRTAITGKAQEVQVKEVLTDTVRKPEVIPPEEKQFQLLIPKLDANMKVVANVDAGDETAYKAALKKGVAHAAGSGLPGEDNTTNKSIYIFGHSTNAIWNIAKYNALFYSLKDLSAGDEIILWFWGKEFRYEVEKIVKVDPADLTYLAPQVLEDQLILQTCWPPGTTWKRLLVIAKPIN